MTDSATATSRPETDNKKTAPPFLIGIRVLGNDRTESFDPGNLKLRVGANVIVETSNGERFGLVASNKIANHRKDLRLPMPRVLRIASAEDSAGQERKAQLESKAYLICLEKIAKLRLAMSLSRVVHLSGQSKLVFYFTAEGRVDFRELVRELAQALRSRIEMRQVGVRDEARAITGYGICGQSLCCSTFLKEFTPVTVRMAKDQGLALNPSKISGICGRLMCCLQYEHALYKSLVKNLPKINARIQTPGGSGKVIKNDILTQRITLRLDDESIMTYHLDELQPGQKQASPPAETAETAENEAPSEPKSDK